jgi:hypothetical protein
MQPVAVKAQRSGQKRKPPEASLRRQKSKSIA